MGTYRARPAHALAVTFVLASAFLLVACSGSSDSSKTAESYLETVTSEASTSESIAANVLEQAGKDIENCEDAATSTDVVRAEDIEACIAGVITMQYDCDMPPALTIVSFESGEWALRAGKAPLKLAANYTFDELMQLCS
jgi:hypothetical protein